MLEASSKRLPDWSNDEDTKLADIVLDHIRTGSTQLKAFDEASEIFTSNEIFTSRTPSACGFRWNSTLRKKYEASIQEARIQKKSGLVSKKQIDGLKLVQPSVGRPPKITSTLEKLDQVLSPEKVREIVEYVQALSSNLAMFQQIRLTVERKEREYQELKTENAELKAKIKELEYAQKNWEEFANFAKRFSNGVNA